MHTVGLRNGDIVEVRSPAEVLSTLDDQGMLDGLPFMPEMISYCGRRFTVDRRAEKICDTIYPTASRRLPDTVLLEDRRCDGSGHDGCQAECRLFWKEAWLRPAGSGESTPMEPDPDAEATLKLLADKNTRVAVEGDGKPTVTYRCQATELNRATLPLRSYDPRPYVREYTTGNVAFGRFLRVSLRAVVQEPLRKLGITPSIPVKGTRTSTSRQTALDLQPGDLVQVKSREEIEETLNPHGKNRGLWFDTEMLPFCGGTYRVRQRVEHFIDDRTGKMIDLTSDCVTLDTVVCSGELSLVRWFCPRAIYPYWREDWLRRVDATPGSASRT